MFGIRGWRLSWTLRLGRVLTGRNSERGDGGRGNKEGRYAAVDSVVGFSAIFGGLCPGVLCALWYPGIGRWSVPWMFPPFRVGVDGTEGLGRPLSSQPIFLTRNICGGSVHVNGGIVTKGYNSHNYDYSQSLLFQVFKEPLRCSPARRRAEGEFLPGAGEYAEGSGRRDREEVYRQAVVLRPERFAILYTGKMPEDTAIVL